MPPKKLKREASDDDEDEYIPVKKHKESVDEVEESKSTKPKEPFPTYDDWIKDLGDWTTPLKDFLDTNQLKEIHDEVEQEYKTKTVYPSANDILKAFKIVPFSKVKAVMVGQDPYINEGEAMGLCFSVPKSTKVPGSLMNMYRALENDEKISFKRPRPMHGDLTKWAEQGILMINSTLTVLKGKSNSHKDIGWTDFTNAVIRAIGNLKTDIVFFLWGKFAQTKKKLIKAGNHLVLEYCHPSPLAATAGANFTKCKDFSKANEYLNEKGSGPINWNVN